LPPNLCIFAIVPEEIITPLSESKKVNAKCSFSDFFGFK
jgi:hypothetical protein